MRPHHAKPLKGRRQNKKNIGKVITLNCLLTAGLTSPLWAPVKLTNHGINYSIKRVELAKGNLHLNPFSSLSINSARSAYFGLPLRNIIQHDPKCFKFSKDLIYEPKPKSTCIQNNIEHKVSVRFERYGNRSNGPSSQNKSFQSVLIGDSHAMGWGVSDHETISAHLSKQGHQTLNLAVSSYGTARELHRLAIWADKNPTEYSNIKNIIIQYCDNDLEENKRFSGDYKSPANANQLAPNYQSPAPNPTHLQYKQSLIELLRKTPTASASIAKKSWEEAFDKLRAHVRLLSLNTPLLGELLIDTGIISKEDRSHSDYFWKSLSNNTKTIKGKNIIVFTSNAHGIRNLETTLDLLQGAKEFQESNPTQSTIVLTLSALEQRKEEAYFAIDDHLNPFGHKLIADELLKELRPKPDQVKQSAIDQP